MEKNLNKIEEMNEEIKMEELNDDSLESVDGGCYKNPSKTFCLHRSCHISYMLEDAYDAGVTVGKTIMRLLS